MNNKPLTRQQKRDLARKSAKNTDQLIKAVDEAMSSLNVKIEILTEAARIIGVTEEIMEQAKHNLRAKAKAASTEAALEIAKAVKVS